VREVLKFWVDLAEGFDKHGDCPLIREEMQKASFLSRAILKKHAAKKAVNPNDRKDIYVSRSSS
jgi:hypothetical protein